MQGRVAIVTGGAGGIGLAIVKNLVASGHTVVLSDMRREEGANLAAEAGADFIAADVSNRDQCAELVAETQRRHGSVDVLINNAGVQHMAPIEDFPVEKWDLLLAVMLTGPFLLTKHAWPGMVKAGWGRIVNVSSVQGLVASTYKVGYVTAKTGMIGLTRTTALEGGIHGITANAICPAYVNTSIVTDQIADQAALHDIPPEDVIDEVFLKTTAIKRLINPDEVAGLVAYLCSDQAGAITGSTFPIDLGYTAQ